MKQSRALTKDGKWAYGWYVEVEGTHYIIPETATTCWATLITKHNFIEGYIEVLPETVGLQTGLSDKNGKEVYDKAKLRSGKRVLTVVWGNDSLQWKAQEEDSDFMTPLCQWAISEHFELLEESK